MKKRDDLSKQLNYNYAHFTNKTMTCGKMDMPALFCQTKIFPDFLALYSELGLYHYTQNTGVCFYEFDSVFDGQNGLFASIYFGNKERLSYFKKRFEGVKFFISPDYSLLGDIPVVENNYRIFKARIVSLWFIHELGAIVIPNISFPNDEYCDLALDGLENCSVVAISTKGHMHDPNERERLKDNIRLTVDKLNLQTIIVYDVCGTANGTLDVFSYASEKGIKVLIPENTLKNRNIIHCVKQKEVC